MSYSEELCEKSLRLIFDDSTEVIRNYRPPWLKNPETGKNLELDFYIPHVNIAIEIQGQHHYEDSDQIFRDKLKKYLLEKKNIHLIELSIFQIAPNNLWKKIVAYCKFSKQPYIKNFDRTWLDIPEFKLYKQKIEEIYGRSKCTKSPYIHHDREKLQSQEYKIMLNSSWNYKLRGNVVKIIPIKILEGGKVSCRVAGSNEIIKVRKSKLGFRKYYHNFAVTFTIPA